MELLVINRWLENALRGDTDLMNEVTGVYHIQAPPEAVYPLIVYGCQEASDLTALGGARVITRALYRIIVVGEGWSLQALEAASNRINTLLQGSSGEAEGGRVLACTRIEPIVSTAVDNGQLYSYLGGTWEIIAQ